jgi:hypothetical protein
LEAIVGEAEFRFVFGEPPEEIKEQMRAEYDRQQMLTVSMQHDLSRLFREQTQDNLRTMRFLMHVLAQNPLAAAFYEGAVATLLEERFGMCACGDNHDADLAEVLDKPEHEKMDEFNEELVADQMKIYGLEADAFGGLTCTNCGKSYPSLKDRMLRPPGLDGCPGCVERAKWG